jgi:hypothetical protein
VKSHVETSVADGLSQYLEEHPRRAAAPSRSASPPPGRGRRPARRATWSSAKGCSTARPCPASWPTARSETRRSASSTWSRATRRAGRRSRGATAASRRSCRYGGRS